MSVRVRIPGIWRGLTAGEAGPLLPGDTVLAVLEQLTRRYPDLTERLFAPDGTLKPHLHLFLNQVEIQSPDGPATPVQDGDEILLLVAVAGG